MFDWYVLMSIIYHGYPWYTQSPPIGTVYMNCYNSTLTISAWQFLYYISLPFESSIAVSRGLALYQQGDSLEREKIPRDPRLEWFQMIQKAVWSRPCLASIQLHHQTSHNTRGWIPSVWQLTGDSWSSFIISTLLLGQNPLSDISGRLTLRQKDYRLQCFVFELFVSVYLVL